MSVTLLEVWRAAHARAVALTAEGAGYLVLAATEEVTSLPRRVRLENVELQVDGGVFITGRESAAPEQAELDLRDTLAHLLGVAAAAGPALLRAASRAQHAHPSGLGAELEKALIPVNRPAARRGLVRLYRETLRAMQAGRLSASLPVSGHAVDEDEAEDESTRVPPVAVAFASAAFHASTPALSPSPPSTYERDVDALTRPETLAARVRAGYPSAAPRSFSEPPTAAAQNTPKLGSLEVMSAGLTAAAPFEEPRMEETERTPEVFDHFDTDIAELAGPESSPALQAALAPPLAGLTLSESGSTDSALTLGDPGSHADEPQVPMQNEKAFDTGMETSSDERVVSSETPTPLLAVEVTPRVDVTPREETRVPYEGLPAEQSEVSALVEGFQVARPTNEVDLRRELSALAGVDLTPGSSSQARAR